MSKVRVERGTEDHSFIVSDPQRDGRSWDVLVEETPDGSRIVEASEGTVSVFSPVEGKVGTLYKLAQVHDEGELRSTKVMSELPERYAYAQSYGVVLDTYGSQCPDGAPQSMADLVTWYVPEHRPEALAIIHVLEQLWVRQPTKSTKPGTTKGLTTDDLVLEATYFTQHGKPFLSFTASAADLLRFVEVIPNSDEHPNYPQRDIDYKRLNRIGTYVTQGGFLLPSIIINLYDSVDVQKVGRKRARINIPSDGRKHAYCLDGQHRLFTFDTNLTPRMLEFGSGTYELPVVALMHENKSVWHDQFVIINTEQKPVNKNQILAMEEHFHSERLSEETNQAVRIAELLNKSTTCALYKKIFIRSGDRGTIIKLKNFTKLIEGHFGPNGTFRTLHGVPLTEHALADIMEGYINALRDLFVEEWESTTHVVTKTAGWEALFSADGVLPKAFEKAQRKIDPAAATQQWARVLGPLRHLEICLEGQYLPLDWTSFKFRPYCSGRVNIENFVKAVTVAYQDVA